MKIRSDLLLNMLALNKITVRQLKEALNVGPCKLVSLMSGEKMWNWDEINALEALCKNIRYPLKKLFDIETIPAANIPRVSVRELPGFDKIYRDWTKSGGGHNGPCQ